LPGIWWISWGVGAGDLTWGNNSRLLRDHFIFQNAPWVFRLSNRTCNYSRIFCQVLYPSCPLRRCPASCKLVQIPLTGSCGSWGVGAGDLTWGNNSRLRDHFIFQNAPWVFRLSNRTCNYSRIFCQMLYPSCPLRRCPASCKLVQIPLTGSCGCHLSSSRNSSHRQKSNRKFSLLTRTKFLRQQHVPYPSPCT